MRKLLSHPATNAICISIFSAFYAVVFIMTQHSSAFHEGLAASATQGKMVWLAGFFYTDKHRYIAFALIALTALVVVLLLRQKATYDEYHTAILTNCLLVAMVLILLAIAALFVSVVLYPYYIIEKFMLFATLHWATVVLADLVYVLFFRR